VCKRPVLISGGERSVPTSLNANHRLRPGGRITLVAACCCPQQLPALVGKLTREGSLQQEYALTDESFDFAVRQYRVGHELML